MRTQELQQASQRVSAAEAATAAARDAAGLEAAAAMEDRGAMEEVGTVLDGGVERLKATSGGRRSVSTSLPVEGRKQRTKEVRGGAVSALRVK